MHRIEAMSSMTDNKRSDFPSKPIASKLNFITLSDILKHFPRNQTHN